MWFSFLERKPVEKSRGFQGRKQRSAPGDRGGEPGLEAETGGGGGTDAGEAGLSKQKEGAEAARGRGAVPRSLSTSTAPCEALPRRLVEEMRRLRREGAAPPLPFSSPQPWLSASAPPLAVGRLRLRLP